MGKTKIPPIFSRICMRYRLSKSQKVSYFHCLYNYRSNYSFLSLLLFIFDFEVCPEAAGYSIHFPMQHCSDKVLRVLQFVVDECEVLPSSAKAPYLMTVELLEQDFSCQVQLCYVHEYNSFSHCYFSFHE